MMKKVGVVVWMLFGLWATDMYAQESPKIAYQFEDIPLMQALDFLEEQYDLTFAFDRLLLENRMIKRSKIGKTDLHDALAHLLQPEKLSFNIVGGKHVLIRKARPEEIVVIPPPPLPTICGQVKDSLTGIPLSAANVWLKGTTKGEYTDNLGAFRLQGPFRQTDTLVLSYVGYQEVAFPLPQLLNQPCKTIELAPIEFAFQQILIKDKAITFLATGERGDGLYLDVDQLGVIPGWGEQDVLRMAQLLPGINTTDESASNLHIRGGTPDQNLILWDGIPVYHTGHFFGMFSAFNSAIVEGIDIYRGDFSARYGGRVSGVLDIKTKPMQLDSVEASIGLNLINANAYAKVPLLSGRSALLIAGRRSLSDLFESQIYQNIFNQVAGRGRIKEEFEPSQKEHTDLELSPSFYFSDFNLKWTIQNDQGGEGSLSFYQGEDALDYGLLFDRENFYLNALYEIDLSNWGLSAQWSQQWNEKWHSQLLFVLTKFKTAYNHRNDLAPGQIASIITQYNAISEQRLEWNNSYKINADQHLNWGYQGVLNEVELTWAIDAPIYDASNKDGRFFSGTTHSFYIDYDYSIPDKLHLDWGLRYSTFDNGYTGSWEPRFSLAYHLSPKLSTKMSIGRYTQVVNQIVLENDLGIGERFWIMADNRQDITAVTSAQFATGARWKGKGWLLDVDVYRKWISGLVSLSLDFDGEWNNPYSGGSAQITGMDLFLKKSWPNYDSWFSYTLGRTSYTFDKINNNEAFPTLHDRLHHIKWTHQFQLGQWEFTLAWFYGTGLPYTQATRGRFVPNETEEEYDTQIEYAGINANRLPTYQRLDWSGAYNFLLGRDLKGKIGWSIFNLTDRANFYSRTYFLRPTNGDYTDPKLITYDRSLLGFTPNLFLKLEW